jgi:Fe-Mn family superoxide dismutase
MNGMVGFKRYELLPLPYGIDALEPYISKEIMDVHYNAHHKGYVSMTNKLLDRYESVIKGESTSYDLQGILRLLTFNLNGHKLHTLFWNSLAPAGKGGDTPGGRIADIIGRQYGGFDGFKKAFTEAANSLPGIGWTLLYYDEEAKGINIMTVENHFMNHVAMTNPILILDEFEHAYYLQYKNKRTDYIDAWWNVVNWENANKILKNLE